MLEALLPSCVAVVETRNDLAEVELFPEERRAVGRAVEKRAREFATGRACARAALGDLGFPAAPIPSGERGEPLWPDGAVGSITHCDGYRACAVARAQALATIGIDAEPNAPLPAGLLGDIARPEEVPAVRLLFRERPEICWDRLLFSAKESVYKAWFPLARRWLGFEDARVEVDAQAGRFTATLLVAAPSLDGRPLQELHGRWRVDDGIIVTAIIVKRDQAASGILASR